MQAPASPAVAAGPKGARRTGGPFVIDTFFVWAAYNSIRHHDGHGPSRLNEREHFFRNAGIVADIGPFGGPTSKVCDVDILSRKDADRKLGGGGVVWAVERDGRNWVAAKPSPGSFTEPFACALDHVPPAKSEVSQKPCL
jgi:hypothetical protein